jgi:hypothetical protein
MAALQRVVMPLLWRCVFAVASAVARMGEWVRDRANGRYTSFDDRRESTTSGDRP